MGLRSTQGNEKRLLSATTLLRKRSLSPLSSRELVTLFVFEKTDGENKKLRCFQEREKSIKSQTPTGAQRSGGTCGSAVLSWKCFSTEESWAFGLPKVMKNGSYSATTLPGSTALPFVISTEAQRSGEICGSAVLSWKCFRQSVPGFPTSRCWQPARYAVFSQEKPHDVDQRNWCRQEIRGA